MLIIFCNIIVKNDTNLQDLIVLIIAKEYFQREFGNGDEYDVQSIQPMKVTQEFDTFDEEKSIKEVESVREPEEVTNDYLKDVQNIMELAFKGKKHV